MKWALELTGVKKHYGARCALDGLTLTVPAGSLFGLVGSNGAGKTTAMSIVAGIVHADGGLVQVLESGGFDPRRHAGRVTLLPQDALLPREGRVREVLCFYAELQGVPRPRIGAMVDRILADVHLSDRADSAVRTLSHGMARRVTIAQAFLGDPDLALLDEPMSGLDPREVLNARRILSERRAGQTVVISSHNLFEIQRLCDQVAIIERGRTVLQDSVETLTGRHHVIQYHVRTLPADLDPIRRALPGMTLTGSEQEHMLTCRYGGTSLSVEDINAVILAFLLESGAGVRRVETGTELEQAYIQETNIIRKETGS